MTKVYARHEFIKEVYAACASGEARRVESLTVGAVQQLNAVVTHSA